MTIQLPLPLTSAAEASAEKSPPINRLREHLHTQGRSLLACADFVADEAGIAAGYLLIEEVRRATTWTRAIDRRVERVRALLMLEHLITMTTRSRPPTCSTTWTVKRYTPAAGMPTFSPLCSTRPLGTG